MSLGALVEVTVASRDVPAAVDFCRRAFELDVLEGDGTVLGAAGVPYGHLRLVPAAADPSVPRPVPWEVGGRVLGIRPRDIEASRARVLAAGASPTPIVSYDVVPGSTTVEYWVNGPDDVTWELPLSQRRGSPGLDADPERGHGELLAAVIVTESVDDALAVFAGAGGMTVFVDGLFSGPPFAALFQLPDDAAVRAAVVVGPDGGMLLELWEFVGLEPLRGPERPVGLKRLTFDVGDPEAVGARLAGAGARPVRPGLLVGPGGVEVELLKNSRPV